MAGRKDEELTDVTLLGNQGTPYSFEYNPEILETFDNQHPYRDYFVKFNCPEFTTLCPKTGQPDPLTRIAITENLTQSLKKWLSTA